MRRLAAPATGTRRYTPAPPDRSVGRRRCRAAATWANRGARFPEIGRRSGKTATETDTAGGAAARTSPLRRRRPSAAHTAIQPHGATGRFARNRPPERASFPTRPCSNTNAQDAWFVGLVILPLHGLVY